MLVVADDGYQTRVLQAELEQRVGDVSTNPAVTASASPGVRSAVMLKTNRILQDHSNTASHDQSIFHVGVLHFPRGEEGEEEGKKSDRLEP